MSISNAAMTANVTAPLADSAVLIPYNAPSSTPSADFEQVLRSVSPPPSSPSTTTSPAPASGSGAAMPFAAQTPFATTPGLGQPSTMAPVGMSGCCCCCQGGMQAMTPATRATTTASMASSATPLTGASPAAGSQAPASFQLPFHGSAEVTQPFGPTSYAAEPAYNGYSHFHTGIDYGVPLNTPIDAAGPGVVVAAGWDSSGFGNRVIIDHGNGVRTLYGHLNQVEVSVGASVQAGQEIGLSGSTGNSSGPHLHFGVEQNGQWVDPAKWLNSSPGQAQTAGAVPAVAMTAAMGGGTLPPPPGSTSMGSTAAPAVQAAAATGGMQSAPSLASLIQQAAASTGVPRSLIAAVVQAESSGNPHAVSAVGAKGLMQLMDSTAAAYGVTNAFDPAQNLRGGATYLHSLLQRYNGNEQLAVAAYNAGPGAVDHYGGIPPYPETQQYVQRVMALQQQYAATGS